MYFCLYNILQWAKRKINNTQTKNPKFATQFRNSASMAYKNQSQAQKKTQIQGHNLKISRTTFRQKSRHISGAWRDNT